MGNPKVDCVLKKRRTETKTTGQGSPSNIKWSPLSSEILPGVMWNLSGEGFKINIGSM